MTITPIDQPLVSIITPAHNSAAYISATINSVLEQSYSNWELLVADDCSTDNTISLVQEYCQQDERIKLIVLASNLGPASSRNQALQQAKGRFIAFLDSDDYWHPQKLQIQINFMLQHQHPFSYTAYQKITEQGELHEVMGVPERLTYNDLLKTCHIGCLTAVYDTHFFGKVEMPPLRKSQDFGLWLLLMQKSGYAAGVNQPLAYYRLRQNSNTANKWQAATYTWRIYRQVAALSLLQSTYYFSNYAIRGFLRTYFPQIARSLGILHS